jgi:phenylpropionate dioxygenase-like ring-hydroxylating dioxygenase large terminal subunit
MFIRNIWYVAGWASEVASGGMLARTLLSTPVVIWRSEDGTAHAFEDLCCHRGAPLSRGRLEGDSLRCMYHGLRFDSDGRCVEIPGQDRVPPTARVRTYPLIEKGTFLWIWMGEAEKADPTLIPDMPWMQSPEWAHIEGYTHYDANYLFLCDNLLDLAHVAYVHPTTLGGDEKYAQAPATIAPLPDGLRVTRWVTDLAPPPFIHQVSPFEGRVDRWNNYDFLLPGLFLMDSGAVPAGSCPPQEPGEGARAFRSTQALTPETEHSSHYWYCQPHNFAVDQPEVTRKVMDAVELAFGEDKAMITSQVQNLERAPHFRSTAIRADEGLVRFRRLFAERVAQETQPQLVTSPA